MSVSLSVFSSTFPFVLSHMPGLDILPALPPRVPTLIQIRAAYKPGVLSTIRTIKACLWRSSRRSENTTDRMLFIVVRPLLLSSAINTS